jgi:hypothetical protein
VLKLENLRTEACFGCLGKSPSQVSDKRGVNKVMIPSTDQPPLFFFLICLPTGILTLANITNYRQHGNAYSCVLLLPTTLPGGFAGAPRPDHVHCPRHCYAPDPRQIQSDLVFSFHSSGGAAIQVLFFCFVHLALRQETGVVSTALSLLSALFGLFSFLPE